MRTVRSDGVRLAVDVYGAGDPVTVVGHGLTGSRHDMAPVAPFVPGTAVLFDFRGHGDSDRPPAGAYSMDHFAADLLAVADEFEATRMVGVSLGGGAALRLLASKPDRFERLVFILPARLERSDGARERLLELATRLEAGEVVAVAEEVLAEEDVAGEHGDDATARDTRRRALLRMNSDGIPPAIREVLDDPPVRDPADMHGIVAPSLVIGQEGDPVHPAAAARDLADMLPNGELILYPDRFALIRDVASLVEGVVRFLTS